MLYYPTLSVHFPSRLSYAWSPGAYPRGPLKYEETTQALSTQGGVEIQTSNPGGDRQMSFKIMPAYPTLYTVLHYAILFHDIIIHPYFYSEQRNWDRALREIKTLEGLVQRLRFQSSGALWYKFS